GDGPGRPDEPGLALDQVVEARRQRIIDLAAADDENEAALLDLSGDFGAGRAQPFRARPLGVLQIVGVVDDAGRVRILVVDADRKAMAGLVRSCLHDRSPLTRAKAGGRSIPLPRPLWAGDSGGGVCAR